VAGEEGRARGERRQLGKRGGAAGDGAGVVLPLVAPSTAWRRTPDAALPGSGRLPAQLARPPPFFPPSLRASLPQSQPPGLSQAARSVSAPPDPSRPLCPGVNGPARVREPKHSFGVGGGEGRAGKLDGGDLEGEGQRRHREGGGEEDGGERASLVKWLVSCPHSIPFFQHEHEPKEAAGVGDRGVSCWGGGCVCHSVRVVLG
jgi:hypothetical protein